MFIGNNTKKEFKLTSGANNHSLLETMEERDLGIIVINDLKPSSQCSAAASKGTSVMGLVKRNLKNLDVDNFLILYKAYTRPYLEYCVQVWSPYLKKDQQLLEKVLRKSTKQVQSFKKLSYKHR
jgi:ribonucleases P/MRP protein subunit RPP40